MFRWIHEGARERPAVSREGWGSVSKRVAPVRSEHASPHASTIKPLQPAVKDGPSRKKVSTLFSARQRVMRGCQGTGRRERRKALYRV
jgi:hypothetical protein